MAVPEYFIYKYTFKDNKVYIGQSQVSGHRYGSSSAYKGQPVYKAMLEDPDYKKEIIEMYEEKFLNNREEYWILYYNSTDPAFGYNIKVVNKQKGIYSDRKIEKSKPVLQYTLDGKLVAEYPSIRAAAKAVNPNSKNKGSDISEFIKYNRDHKSHVYGYV